MHTEAANGGIVELIQEGEMVARDGIEPPTREFSVLRVTGLSVTIVHQLNESKRLKPLGSPSIYRLAHIETNSSGKVVTKQVDD
jgi:hypothetical protein